MDTIPITVDSKPGIMAESVPGIMVECVLGTIWTWPKKGLAVRHSYIQNNGFSLRFGGELFSFNPT